MFEGDKVVWHNDVKNITCPYPGEVCGLISMAFDWTEDGTTKSRKCSNVYSLQINTKCGNLFMVKIVVQPNQTHYKIKLKDTKY